MTGLFVIEKREAVQEMQSTKNPGVTYPTCNVVLRTADSGYGDAFVARMRGDQTKLPLQEGETVVAGLSFYASETNGRVYQNCNVTRITKVGD